MHVRRVVWLQQRCATSDSHLPAEENHMVWNPVDWSKAFHAAAAAGDGESLRRLRRKVFASTVDAVRAQGYEVESERIDLDPDGSYEALHQDTVFYGETAGMAVPHELRNRFRTAVSVHNADFLEIARAIAAPSETPAVLNMASRRNPGGGVAEGAGAQEENLFRRSTALYSLYQFVDYGKDYGVPRNASTSYPIPRESGGIYSPGVTVFRSTEASGYAFLRQPCRVNVVTVPAINAPELLERDGRCWLTDEMARATAVKIRAILRIAAHHRQTALVLSAFGCGAFRNPPHHVAALFHDALNEPEFVGVFGRVAFAVIDDHNAFRAASPEGNYLPFERAFGDS